MYGDAEAFTYDAIVEVRFEIQAGLVVLLKNMLSAEFLEDEDRFTDRTKLRAVGMGETTVTRRA